MMELVSLATEGAAIYSFDWSNRVPVGMQLVAVAYEPDPPTGLTLSNIELDPGTGVAKVTIAADTTKNTYRIKMKPTLTGSSISPVSAQLRVLKHKPAY